MASGLPTPNVQPESGAPMHRLTVIPTALALAVLAACSSTEPTAPLTRHFSPAPPQFATVATQADADAISANIRALHMPYGTLADPGFASSDPTAGDYATVVSYNRTGDGAIWTGHYLAAE